MQTCYHIIKDRELHNLPIITVRSELRERIMSLNDFPLFWKELRNKNEYSYFDFSEMNRY